MASALVLLSAAPSARERPAPVHEQRYCMGTMFDIVAYDASRSKATAAVTRALDEIVRLDQVLSHYKADSDLAALVRDGGQRFVRVDPALFDVLRASLDVSRRSNGKFDVTIAPLMRVWREAQQTGRLPAAAAIGAARRCVGFEKIEMRLPDQVRLHSGCVELDLGGIGKGYAVDRAAAVLRSAGIQSALVNAGGSSIAAIGAPPAARGWPVRLGAELAGRRELLLRDSSVSTAGQQLVPLSLEPGAYGEILDPHSGAPAAGRFAVSVVAPSGTLGDALDTTLVMLSIEEGTALLSQFPGVSAIWVSSDGHLEGTYRTSGLELADAR